MKDALIINIRAFIEKYANISPNWDGESADEKYTGPDPYQLLMVIDYIEAGLKPKYPWSEWGSGCYGRYSDREGRESHDQLLNQIKEYINN